ncbi:MAG: hypothetical protein JSU74_02775 [Candidatus Zixiibacteriota bacterium]|nr:MAG: hypothetical protein JSU74_02775 [candidate division Zixibacteria bacterium]
MTKYLVMIIGCLALLAGAASSQEVVITDFPLGIAGSVDPKIFEPYLPQLEAISDTLNQDPTALAVVTGGSDGQRYRSSHDAKNPSLALGRAHALLSLLMEEFDVDSTQIVIRTEESKVIGPEYRYVSIKLAPELTKEEPPVDPRIDLLMARVDDLEARPPVEKHFTEVQTPLEEEESDLGIQFGVGVSSSPFGGIPVVTTAFTYKRVVYVEGIVGHTWWTNSFEFEGEDLDTRRRQIGGHAIIYPFENLSLGFLGGWLRVEEMSQRYYEYAKLSEGPVIGLRALPHKHLAVTVGYNPAKHRIATRETSTTESDQFLIYLTAHMGIGGAR